MLNKKIIRLFCAALLPIVSACGTTTQELLPASSEEYTPELAQKYLGDGNYEEAIEVYTAL